LRGRQAGRTFGVCQGRRTNVDESGKEPASRGAVAARVILTIGPFVLLFALYAVLRWLS